MATRSSFSPDTFTLGFCLLGAGVVWTAHSLSGVDALGVLHTWWPTSLVVWGIAELVATAQHRARRRAPDGDRS